MRSVPALLLPKSKAGTLRLHRAAARLALATPRKRRQEREDACFGEF